MLSRIFLLCLSLGLCLAAPNKRANARIDAPGCGLRPVLADNGASDVGIMSGGMSGGVAPGIAARVVNGNESVPYSWPSICSFQTSSGFPICGSTLVQNKQGVYYLVTAAHCLSNTRPRQYRAVCGIHSTETGSTNQVILMFSKIIKHENYDTITLENDIAIFELSNQPPQNDYIQPACIANGPHAEGELAIVVGWGTLHYEGPASSVLRQAIKPIKSESTCYYRYPRDFISSSMFCAGLPGGGVDACQGDSGGPLYTYRGGLWYLTGVVSWGIGCAFPENPGVYADVYKLESWIDAVIN